MALFARSLPSGLDYSFTKDGSLNKAHGDKWISTPPQVTSYLTYACTEPSDDRSSHLYTSGACGFGWRFQLVETFHYRRSVSDNRLQELVGRARLKLLPHKCSSMPLGTFKANVKVSFLGHNGKSTGSHMKEFEDLSIQSEIELGTYEELVQYAGLVRLEVCLIFDPASELALPTTLSASSQKALHHSLDGPTFVDTKFYLYSAKIQGRPALPRPVYAKSALCSELSHYLRNLLSCESAFAGGTPCDLCSDVPEEISKLDPNLYEYEDDSDLEESDVPGITGKGKAPENTSEKKDGSDLNDCPREAYTNPTFIDGRAFAINGTAHKTWKAFMFYVYTNTIQFNKLKSQQTEQDQVSDPEFTACSPKSMYRLADYVDLPDLKVLAKESIRRSLSRSNIVQELFSAFTSKYPEVAEIEVNFLVENFSGSVRKDFDEMLRMVVLGTKGHCFRVLAFTIKRLSGDNTQSARAAMDGIEGRSIFGSGEEAGEGNLLGKPTASGVKTKKKIKKVAE